MTTERRDGAIDDLCADITVPLPAEVAFAHFTDRFREWWPPTFTWSQPDHLDHVAFGRGVGALLSEIGPHGFRIDWGRVAAWDPPRAVTFTWQIGADRVPVPDPAAASEVDVTFTDHPDGCRVAVRHHGWRRHGPGAAAYRDELSGAWPVALEAFAASAHARR